MRGTTELLKDIVNDLDDSIESGDYSQEEIVDMVTKGLEAEGYAPDDVTTKTGAQAEALVEAAFLSFNLYCPPHRVCRDSLARTTNLGCPSSFA